MPTNDPLLAPDQIFDGYHLIRFLGRGGFGEVWLCRSGATDTYHALKFVSGKDADLIAKEHHSLGLYRSAAARLRSPHLVPIEHINRHPAGLYYIMPLADGTSATDPTEPSWQPLSLAAYLGARAEAPTWFSSREIIGLIQPILDALQSLSDAGLVHRDVKPDNILFFNGSPCLGDISLLGEDAAVITRRGTPGYATPSWYRGGHPDMYGASATLYTLLTGNPPDMMGKSAFLWPPQGEHSLTESERAEWKRLHAVIRRATDEKVGERYVDFRAMATAVDAAPAPSLPPPLPLPPSNPPPLPSSSRKMQTSLVAATAVFGVAAVVILALILSSSPEAVNKPENRQNPVPENQPNTPRTQRPPKIVDMRGHFKSVRQRVIEVLPGAISVPSDGTVRLDLGEHVKTMAIMGAYESRDYEKCLELLDQRMASHPSLGASQSFSLARALVLKRLERTKEVESLMSRLDTSPKIGSMEGLKIQLILLEALEFFSHGERLVSSVISSVPATIPASEQVTLYNLRARFRILTGNHAGALADERAALELPPGIISGGSAESAEEVRQNHLNTIVLEWELLEQELPAYADYLEANGSPEPKPDHRNLKAVD